LSEITDDRKDSGPTQILNFKSWKFPSGEVGFRIDSEQLKNVSFQDASIVIDSQLTSSDSIIELFMAVDAIRRIRPYDVLFLNAPFLPYGRQDRVCSPGESFSLQVFKNLMDDLFFNNIFTIEPHSKVTIDKFRNLSVISKDHEFRNLFLENYSGELKDLLFVAPDKGAKERVENFAKGFPFFPTVFHASKVRNQLTGEIVGLSLEGNVENKDVVIFDDLVDGGRTFIELAKLLKEKKANKIYLLVVHGIFSKGYKELSELYDLVISTNSYRDLEKEQLPSNFKIINVWY
jgi:ribose-phosphate pyrophosphokinase